MLAGNPTFKKAHAEMVDRFFEGEQVPSLISDYAHRILPAYAREPRTAEEAVEAGAGNCYAHTEVVAALTVGLPNIRTMISVGRIVGESEVHTECLVIDRAHSGFTIDNARRHPLVTPVDPKSSTPESLALRLAQKQPHLPLSSVNGVKSNKRWHSTVIDLHEPMLPEVKFKPVRHRLVMPRELGLKVLDTVRQARSIWYQNPHQFDDYTQTQTELLPPFDIRPSAS